MLTEWGWLIDANDHLEAMEARTAAMERSGLELERFSREAAVALRNSRSAESRSLNGRDCKKISAKSDQFWSISFQHGSMIPVRMWRTQAQEL